MNVRHRCVLLGLIWSAVLALGVPAKANSINGTLNTTFGFTESATSLLFCTSAGIPCANTPTGTFDVPIGGDSGSGDFITGGPYADDTSGVTVTNLNSMDEPVGTVLPGDGVPFLTFNPSGGLDIRLWVTEVLPGAGTLGACATGIGPCTPNGSAVTFFNTPIGSTAIINIVGEAERISTGQFDLLTGIFTAQFTSDYQTELALFAANGSISTSGSASLTATPTPEPMTSMLLGSGLLAFCIMLRRNRRS
jgi:hypothetical protein